jgi:CheY-like chemotaxis protein
MTCQLNVLVVEDDEDDFFLTERVLRRFTHGRIVQVESGRGAIEYLAGDGAFVDRVRYPFPDVVFLDLKINQMNGHEVLKEIRDNPPHPLPRIFVLTGSNEPKDREMVKSTGIATGYLVKPLTPEHLATIFPST